jgi:hypothetical protein
VLDLLYALLTVGFFAAAIAYVAACGRIAPVDSETAGVIDDPLPRDDRANWHPRRDRLGPQLVAALRMLLALSVLCLGPGGSALLATGTMGTSAGVASSALDSYTPVGGLTALGPILLGEVSPGGVGARHGR